MEDHAHERALRGMQFHDSDCALLVSPIDQRPCDCKVRRIVEMYLQRRTGADRGTGWLLARRD